MSLDESAIKLIQNTAIAAVATVNSDMPAILVPDSMSIEIVEHLQNERSRFRGRMITRVIDSFVNYVKAITGEVSGIAKSECFIDIDRMGAKTFFNLGDYSVPGHGDHNATVELRKTPAFREILNIDGEKIKQKELAEFLEDWFLNIKALDATGEEIPLKEAIFRIRRITVEAGKSQSHNVGDFKSERTAMEKIEASSKDGELPSGFTFTCEPYIGLGEMSFFLRMSLLTGGDQPVFVLRIVRLDDERIKIGKEFERLLKASLENTPVNIYIGQFDND